jgi:hypothetical protein
LPWKLNRDGRISFDELTIGMKYGLLRKPVVKRPIPPAGRWFWCVSGLLLHTGNDPNSAHDNEPYSADMLRCVPFVSDLTMLWADVG